MADLDLTSRGERYGWLVIEYAKPGQRIVCRCACQRQVHVAAADLRDGAITSCGCQSPSPRFRKNQRQLRALLKREIDFDIAARR